MSFLVVGLGNPGSRYHETRHNIGYMVVDCYVKKTRKKYRFSENLYYQCFQTGDSFFIKPLLYMNRSGDAVRHFLRKNSETPDDILIIHDDMDIRYGYIKFSENKGSGGHKGIESINSVLPAGMTRRCRVGISKPPIDEDPVDYVLEGFSEEEKRYLDILIEKISDSVDIYLHDGFSRAANLYNRVNLIPDMAQADQSH